MNEEQNVVVFARNAESRKHLREVLAGLPCSIIESTSVGEAERLVTSQGVALLIAQGMFDAPGEAGLFLRAQMQHPPVACIAITERYDADVVDFAARVGTSALLAAPADPHTLRNKAQAALNLCCFSQGLPELREALRRWENDLLCLEQATHLLGANKDTRPAHALMAMLTRHLAHIVHQTTDIAWACMEDHDVPLCQVTECPQMKDLTSVVEEAVSVLEETKKSFKSKQLAVLRTRLESVLERSN